MMTAAIPHVSDDLAGIIALRLRRHAVERSR
jgi:hypothetical protein